MEKSIETIWKEGFLEKETSLVPKLNNLYHQKSINLIEKFKRMYKVNLIVVIIMALSFPIIYYFIDAFWQGVAISLLLLGLAWYGNIQLRQIHNLNQGMSSYDYLKSFNGFLDKITTRMVVIMRLFYPLAFLISISAVWFGNDNQVKLSEKLIRKFPDMLFVGGMPLIGLIATGIIVAIIAIFSGKIYQWDMGLVYGRIFKKLRETLAEMEELRS